MLNINILASHRCDFQVSGFFETPFFKWKFLCSYFSPVNFLLFLCVLLIIIAESDRGSSCVLRPAAFRRRLLRQQKGLDLDCGSSLHYSSMGDEILQAADNFLFMTITLLHIWLTVGGCGRAYLESPSATLSVTTYYTTSDFLFNLTALDRLAPFIGALLITVGEMWMLSAVM